MFNPLPLRIFINFCFTRAIIVYALAVAYKSVISPLPPPPNSFRDLWGRAVGCIWSLEPHLDSSLSSTPSPWVTSQVISLTFLPYLQREKIIPTFLSCFKDHKRPFTPQPATHLVGVQEDCSGGWNPVCQPGEERGPDRCFHLSHPRPAHLGAVPPWPTPSTLQSCLPSPA